MEKYIEELKTMIPKALDDKADATVQGDQWTACLECVQEMANAWEILNGKNLVWVPGHYEAKTPTDDTTQIGPPLSYPYYHLCYFDKDGCYDENINAELVYNADLCVSPGNIGLTAIHVLMFGCPAISNDDFSHQMPEFEAIQEGKTGTFFEMDNINDLSAKIDAWFMTNGNKRDEIRLNCFKEIDEQWNPYFQIEVLKKQLQHD